MRCAHLPLPVVEVKAQDVCGVLRAAGDAADQEDFATGLQDGRPTPCTINIVHLEFFPLYLFTT